MDFKRLGKATATALLMSSLVFGATVAPSPLTGSQEVQAAAAKTYKVEKGDTLYRISVNHKVTVNELKSWNKLTSNSIRVGQVLKVSAVQSANTPAKPAPTAPAKTYKVAKGDTLYRISVNHKVTVNELKSWNNLTSNSIRVGQILNVSAGTPSTTPPPTNTAKPTPPPKPSTIAASYKTVRYYDTNIHVYISSSNAKLAVSKGVAGKLEPLSQIKVTNEVAKTNLGFFDFKGTYEHSGIFMVNGKLYQNHARRFIPMIYYRNGKIDVRNYGATIDAKEIARLRKEAYFVVGTSYSLVQNGKVNLTNSEMYSHSNQRNPRTMFGQTADGRFIMAVTDGRTKTSKGLTAQMSAEVMLKLGAVVATNMDGGGSSTMIVDGKIKNQLPGGQRRIGSAIFVTK